MSEMQPIFDQINLVVRDMAAMIEFYERLGIAIEPTIEPFAAHHRTRVKGQCPAYRSTRHHSVDMRRAV